jgi:DNA-directed RNA polymerase alpha subunit
LSPAKEELTEVIIPWRRERRRVVVTMAIRERLSENERRILEYYATCKTNAEVARKLGCSYSQVARKIRKALQRLDCLERLTQDGISPDSSIDVLDLSVRAANCLQSLFRDHEKPTLGDLANKTADDILRAKNSGKKTLAEIQRLLNDVGMSLKGGLSVESIRTKLEREQQVLVKRIQMDQDRLVVIDRLLQDLGIDQ